MPSNHLILGCPLLLLPPIFPSFRVCSKESALHIKWPKYWSSSFNISPSNEHPGLISFRMNWLDLLAVQGTIKSLLQHHSSKASILRRSAFFIVQLSHPYMTTGKTIALRQTKNVVKHCKGFPGGSVVKKPPANARDQGSNPGLGRTPEKEMVTHSSVLAWEIPWAEKPNSKNPPSYFFSSLPSCLCSPIPNLLTFFSLPPLFPFSLLKLALRLG